MMKIQKAYKILLLITTFFTASHVFAINEPDVEKKKTYSKSYAAGTNDQVSLNNQFGELRINTWNKNEIKVDVSITAKANTDERAQQILDNITIEDGKNNSGVWFKTNMENKKNKGKNTTYKNEGFSINYTVFMPSKNALKVSNSFGSTIIPDISGEADIESKFGSLEAGNLTNVKSVVIEFGTGEIKSMNDGKLVVKFSRAIVHKMSGSVNATFEHSSGIKLGIDNSIRDLNVKNNFSTLYLDVNKNLSANFDIRTHFGDFSNKTEFVINKENEDDNRHGPKFDHQYSGRSGNGNVKMSIRSEFGNVIVGHELPMNLEEKSKKKTRTI